MHVLSNNSAGGLKKDIKSRKARIVVRAFAGKDIPLNIKVYRTSQHRLNESVLPFPDRNLPIKALFSNTDGHIAFDSGIYNFGLAFGQVDLARTFE